MFVQPLCSQKLAAFELGIFLRVSLAFIIENIPHANKKGKANSRVVLGSLDWNLKLSGMRLVLSCLIEKIALFWIEAQRSPGCGCRWISMRVSGLWRLEKGWDSPGVCMLWLSKAHWEWSTIVGSLTCNHCSPFRWWCGACSSSVDLPFFPMRPNFRKLKWYSCVIPPSSCPSTCSAFWGVLKGSSSEYSNWGIAHLGEGVTVVSCVCAHSGVCVSKVVSWMEKSQEVLHRFMQH